MLLHRHGVTMALDVTLLCNVATAWAGSTYTAIYDVGEVESDSGLLQGPNGVLYGTNAYASATGTVSVFQLTPPTTPATTWTRVTLMTAKLGSSIVGTLAMDSGGTLYGVTQTGGGHGVGSVFKLEPPGLKHLDWHYTELYGFTGKSDGAYPYDGVTVADGALYGTTYQAGAGSGGSVFRLASPVANQTQWQFSTLYSFLGAGNPAGGVIVRTVGGRTAVFGTTSYGDPDGFRGGGVFQLTAPASLSTTWTLAWLHDFQGANGSPIPYQPRFQLVADRNLNLYGVATLGGKFGYGAVFRLSPPTPAATVWTYSQLYDFTDGQDGGVPAGPLTEGVDGRLYGTTAVGGTTCSLNPQDNCGTVFRLTPRDQGGVTLPWNEQTLYGNTPRMDMPHGHLVVQAGPAPGETSLYGLASAVNAGVAYRLRVSE